MSSCLWNVSSHLQSCHLPSPCLLWSLEARFVEEAIVVHAYVKRGELKTFLGPASSLSQIRKRLDDVHFTAVSHWSATTTLTPHIFRCNYDKWRHHQTLSKRDVEPWRQQKKWKARRKSDISKRCTLSWQTRYFSRIRELQNFSYHKEERSEKCDSWFCDYTEAF